MTFQERIELLVNRAGGQNALARKSGMSLGAVQRYLKGGDPTRSAMIRLCKAGDVTLNWLAFGIEDESGGSASHSYKLHGFGDSAEQGWYDAVEYRINAELDWPDPQIFAIAVTDDLWEHEGLKKGYICMVSPNTTPREDDIVYLKNKDGKASLKKFMGDDSQWLYLQGWYDEETSFEEQVKKDDLAQVAPVIFVKRRA